MIGPAKPVDDCGRIAYGDAMGLRIGALIVDSQDPGRLARFWAEALDPAVVLASGRLNTTGDTISIELISPDAMPAVHLHQQTFESPSRDGIGRGFSLLVRWALAFVAPLWVLSLCGFLMVARRQQQFASPLPVTPQTLSEAQSCNPRRRHRLSRF